MKTKLTKTFVDKHTLTEGGQLFIRDTELTGFGLRIGMNSKNYFVEKRINGKSIRKVIGNAEHFTPEEARKRAQVTLGKMADGVNPVEEKKAKAYAKTTLEEAFETYKKNRTLRPTTIKGMNYTFSQVFEDWKPKPLNEITREMVQKRFQYVSTNSGEGHANNVMVDLRTVFNFAIAHYRKNDDESLIRRNPVKVLSDTKMWHPKKRKQRIVPFERLADWYGAVAALKSTLVSTQGETIRDVLIFILFTGLRKSEALTLKWSEVDFKAMTILIQRTKNGNPLTLPMTQHLMQLLTERYAKTDSVFVFSGEGKQGYLQEPRKQMAKITTETGIEFSLHDLRRNFVTAACKIVPVYIAKRLVNHTISYTDVTDGYNVVSTQDLREAMESVSAFLFHHINQPSQIVAHKK